jgi:REP element-mobilizing transposase RayT
MPDHIHILISIKPNLSISQLVNDIKTNSSKWINSKSLVKGQFHWQEGFGAFSYSQSHLDLVIGYINNQEKHHQSTSFREEYIELLKKYNLDFEDKYLFEWIE